MTASAAPAFRAANVAETPLGRTGTVDEVAPLVALPASATRPPSSPAPRSPSTAA